MKKRIRIKDIADKAGVSTGTVDRVLHNRGNVSQKAKEKVMAVIKEQGYERNLLASALAYNRQVSIAALLPTPENDPYWEQTDMGVQRAIKTVQQYGLVTETLYFDYSNPKSFVEKAKEILKNKPDGMLFPPMFSEEAHWLLDQCEEKGIANVIINTDIEGASPLSYIGQDSYQSGVLGARLLDFGLNSGQTACILNLDFGTKAAYHLLDKEKGFRAYFKDKVNKKIDIFRIDFENFNDPKALKAFLKGLLDAHPNLSGIFVTNSRAYKIVDCINEVTGKKIKIVGFDLVDANLHYLKDNKIDFLINQNPMDQGFQGIISLFKHLLLKEKVVAIQYLPLDIVVKENAEYYVKRQTNYELIF